MCGYRSPSARCAPGGYSLMETFIRLLPYLLQKLLNFPKMYISEKSKGLSLIVTKRCQIAMRLSAFSLLQMTSQEQCDRLRTDTHGTLRCVLFERWPCFRKEQYESGTWSSIAQKGFHCISGGGLVSRSSFEGDPEHDSGQEAPFYSCRKHKW